MLKRQPQRQNWLKTKIAKILFPSCCIFCGRIMPESENSCVCPQCAAKTEKLNAEILHDGGEFFDGYVCVYSYDGAARKAMLNYKFNRRSFMAPVFASLMAEQISKAGMTDFDIITWVPVHRQTKRKRGYDQAELLAKHMSKEIGCPYTQMLRKNRHTEPMHTLGAAERRANVLGAFETLHGARNLDGVKILLVDDTFTTGATVSECARVLKTAGAEKVMCATLAKTQRGNEKKAQK